jgi:hypothetical protein
MSDLDVLLERARRADRSERITFRDPIAAHGSAAIPAMREWLVDAEFGAFAVRVLAKIAERPLDRRAAVSALESVNLTEVGQPVADDVRDAIQRLGRSRGPSISRSATAGPKPWVGYETATPLERRFHDAMLDIFRLAGEATRKQRTDGTYVRGYWASYFLRGVRNHGGVAYAHQLLHTEGTTDGFKRLTDEGRLDLTMEALVLRPEFEPLFSAQERQVAASRFARAGYQAARTL